MLFMVVRRKPSRRSGAVTGGTELHDDSFLIRHPFAECYQY